MRSPICPQLNNITKNSIQTLGGRDAISFCYYDCLCKTEPQILLTTKSRLQSCSGESPSFVTRGHLTIGNSHPNFFQLHDKIIAYVEHLFNICYNFIFNIRLSVKMYFIAEVR